MKENIFQRKISMCWMFLFFSIILEVCGTSFLKYSQELFPKPGLLVAIFAICLSYFTLSKAIIQIPLGVAYAIWESSGLAFIALISVLFLGESMDIKKASGLLMVFLGSVLIHQGTGSGEAKKTNKTMKAKQTASQTTNKEPGVSKTLKPEDKTDSHIFADKGEKQ